MEPKGMIYKAIAGVMEDIGVVGKEKVFKSNQGSYMFRGIDDVMNALYPAMVKNKVFVVPVILEQIREVRTSRSGTAMYVSICKIQYDFFAEDGSSVSAVVIGEGMDTGDKATNKAMSIAFKYACFQVFCIPTEEMIDPDSERPELEGDKKAGNKQKATAKKTTPITQIQNVSKTSVEKVSTDMINTVQSLVDKYSSKGLKMDKILSMYKIADITEMSIDQFKDCMEKMKLYEDGGNKSE